MASLLKTDARGLNEYAKDYNAIYPIAARCGVFAKSDIQPLINEGATKEDLAASIFQAVVNQTISGLACGKPIRGNVAFLGGPLHFLSELRESFIRTLNLGPSQIIAPDHSHLFAAIGSAMNYKEGVCVDVMDIIHKLQGKIKLDFEVERMEPLFIDKQDYENFTKRHDSAKVKTAPLDNYEGNCYQRKIKKICQPYGCLRNYCKDAERDNSDCSCNINNCRAVWIYVLYGNFCNTAGS